MTFDENFSADNCNAYRRVSGCYQLADGGWDVGGGERDGLGGVDADEEVSLADLSSNAKASCPQRQAGGSAASIIFSQSSEEGEVMSIGTYPF